MKRIFVFLIFFAQASLAQKLKKGDKIIVENLKSHIGFLADDKLEGRRAGSAGEKVASDYLVNQLLLNTNHLILV